MALHICAMCFTKGKTEFIKKKKNEGKAKIFALILLISFKHNVMANGHNGSFYMNEPDGHNFSLFQMCQYSIFIFNA